MPPDRADDTTAELDDDHADAGGFAAAASDESAPVHSPERAHDAYRTLLDIIEEERSGPQGDAEAVYHPPRQMYVPREMAESLRAPLPDDHGAGSSTAEGLPLQTAGEAFESVTGYAIAIDPSLDEPHLLPEDPGDLHGDAQFLTDPPQSYIEAVTAVYRDRDIDDPHLDERVTLKAPFVVEDYHVTLKTVAEVDAIDDATVSAPEHHFALYADGVAVEPTDATRQALARRGRYGSEGQSLPSGTGPTATEGLTQTATRMVPIATLTTSTAVEHATGDAGASDVELQQFRRHAVPAVREYLDRRLTNPLHARRHAPPDAEAEYERIVIGVETWHLGALYVSPSSIREQARAAGTADQHIELVDGTPLADPTTDPA